MSRRLLYFLLAFCFQLHASAQNTETQAIQIDTTVTVTTDSLVYTDDEDEKASFDTITVSSPIIVRTIPDSTIKRLQQSDEYWYASLAPERKTQQETDRTPGFNPPSWVRKVLWIVLLGGFLGLVAWFLWTSRTGLFQRTAKTTDDESLLEEDIHAIDFEKEKSKAEAEGDYRLATRLWFLQTLKGLTDRGIIQYSQEKTNRDYLDQLFGTKAYNGFFQLTRSFEYTWYGQFTLSKEAYQRIAQSFFTFNRQWA